MRRVVVALVSLSLASGCFGKVESNPLERDEAADLTVSLEELGHRPTFALDESAYVSLTVHNAGGPTGSEFWTRHVLSRDDQPSDDDVILAPDLHTAPLERGAASGYYVELSIYAGWLGVSEGDYWVLVTTDFDDEIVEQSEANNTLQAGPIHVVPTP